MSLVLMDDDEGYDYDKGGDGQEGDDDQGRHYDQGLNVKGGHSFLRPSGCYIAL